MTDVFLVIILGVIIFNGLIRMAILGNLNKIYNMLEEMRKKS